MVVLQRWDLGVVFRCCSLDSSFKILLCEFFLMR